MTQLPSDPPAKRPAMGRWLVIALLGWTCLKLGGCLLMVPGTWGPRIGGTLPNGHRIYFQARPVGRETDDRLTWVAPDGSTRRFWLDQIHAGFAHVAIKYIDKGDRVWVESDGKVGASLDLSSADFRAERDRQHAWAIVGGGTKLDAGSTSSMLWLFVPW